MRPRTVFIKPHALTDAVKALVSETLTAGGFKILEEGEIVRRCPHMPSLPPSI